MSDLITSIIRDWTGKLVGAVVGLALAAGVTIPADLSAQATAAISGVMLVAVQLVYYVAVRAAEQRWPAAGRLLGAASAPGYGLNVPIHTRLVIDHEKTGAEVAAFYQQLQNQLLTVQRQAQQQARGGSR
ncbi:hypothetical protein ACFQHO_44750 [Actinomadura yumaensis]|uniref:hypothetical protein n=1 Tax=Actinomadura TaxID=1988 RepID=UPI0019D4FE9B|nr:hypothetical protein [Actinomadura sp. J1-007]